MIVITKCTTTLQTLKVNGIKYDKRPMTFDTDLVDSIRNHGVMSPVIIFNGKLTDGQARVTICKKLRIKEIPAYITNVSEIELDEGDLEIIQSAVKPVSKILWKKLKELK